RPRAPAWGAASRTNAGPNRSGSRPTRPRSAVAGRPAGAYPRWPARPPRSPPARTIPASPSGRRYRFRSVRWLSSRSPCRGDASQGEAAAGQLLASQGYAVRSLFLRLRQPLCEFPEPLVQGDSRPVAEQGLGAGDIRETVADIPHTVLPANLGLDIVDSKRSRHVPGDVGD